MTNKTKDVKPKPTKLNKPTKDVKGWEERFDEKFGEFVFATGLESINSEKVKQFLAQEVDRAYKKGYQDGKKEL